MGAFWSGVVLVCYYMYQEERLVEETDTCYTGWETDASADSVDGGDVKLMVRLVAPAIHINLMLLELAGSADKKPFTGNSLFWL